MCCVAKECHAIAWDDWHTENTDRADKHGYDVGLIFSVFGPCRRAVKYCRRANAWQHFSREVSRKNTKGQRKMRLWPERPLLFEYSVLIE